MNRSKKILIMFAMESEAAPLVKTLGLGAFDEWVGPRLQARAVRGSLEGRDIMIVHTGKDKRFGVDSVGPHPAAVTAYVAMISETPDIVISAGTAGGFGRQGTCVGDVFVSSGALMFHDRRIPIEGFRQYGEGSYPCVNLNGIAADLGVKQGVVSTGASLDATPEDLARLENSQAAVKDMEAAAIGWVAEQFKRPMVAVKAITDLVDHPASTADQFAANFGTAVINLADKLGQLVRRI